MKKLWKLKFHTFYKSFIEIEIFFIARQSEIIFYGRIIYFFRPYRSDIESSLVENISNLTKKSLFVSKCQYYLYRDTFDFRITPMCRNTTIELHFFHVFTIEFMYRDYPHTDSSYDLISRFRITALSFFIRDISLFSYYYIALIWLISFSSGSFFL